MFKKIHKVFSGNLCLKKFSNIANLASKYDCSFFCIFRSRYDAREIIMIFENLKFATL